MCETLPNGQEMCSKSIKCGDGEDLKKGQLVFLRPEASVSLEGGAKLGSDYVATAGVTISMTILEVQVPVTLEANMGGTIGAGCTGLQVLSKAGEGSVSFEVESWAVGRQEWELFKWAGLEWAYPSKETFIGSCASKVGIPDPKPPLLLDPLDSSCQVVLYDGLDGNAADNKYTYAVQASTLKKCLKHFVLQTTPCNGADVIKNTVPWTIGHGKNEAVPSSGGKDGGEYSCRRAARELGLNFATVMTTYEWASGCLFHDGNVYYSPHKEGSSENPTDAYICWSDNWKTSAGWTKQKNQLCLETTDGQKMVLPELIQESAKSATTYGNCLNVQFIDNDGGGADAALTDPPDDNNVFMMGRGTYNFEYDLEEDVAAVAITPFIPKPADYDKGCPTDSNGNVIFDYENAEKKGADGNRLTCNEWLETENPRCCHLMGFYYTEYTGLVAWNAGECVDPDKPSDGVCMIDGKHGLSSIRVSNGCNSIFLGAVDTVDNTFAKGSLPQLDYLKHGLKYVQGWPKTSSRDKQLNCDDGTCYHRTASDFSMLTATNSDRPKVTLCSAPT